MRIVTAQCYADEQPDGSWTVSLTFSNVPASHVAHLAAWMEAVFKANSPQVGITESELKKETMQ